MHTHSIRVCIAVVVFSFVAVTSCQAEDIEITHCYAGVYSAFNKTEGTSVLGSWRQDGILTSAHPKKLLQNATVRCEGIQMGLAAERQMHAFCRIQDEEGDVIVAELPWGQKGIDYRLNFLEGTGKWKGVTGHLNSTVIARGPRSATDPYLGCRRETGQFELPK
jgi:hypothetical protein